MTVSCPACGTRYRLPPRSRLGARPTFRCTRCDHVFDPEEGSEGPAVVDEEDVPTTFDMADEAPAVAAGDDDVTQAIEPPPAPRARRRREEATGTAPAAAGPPPRRGSSPARFALRTMVLVTLAYAVLSVYLYTHPARVDAVLGSLPIVGEQLGGPGRLDPRDIQLTDVRGTYARAADDELVFVVTGTAVNNAPLPASGVQVQAHVVGASEARQTVFAGAAPRDVHELSAREIDLLQTLQPPKEWTLGPGEQAPFIIAFRSPPVSLREFSVEVVAVRKAFGRR